MSKFLLRAVAAASLAVGASLPMADRAVAQDTIKVGVLHSLSGTMAISETTLKDTMLMLVEGQNEKGGVLGCQIEPVVVDPSHSGGRRRLVAPLSLAGVAAGADGLMIDVHPAPETALVDGSQAILPDEFASLMEQIRGVAEALARYLDCGYRTFILDIPSEPQDLVHTLRAFEAARAGTLVSAANA